MLNNFGAIWQPRTYWWLHSRWARLYLIHGKIEKMKELCTHPAQAGNLMSFSSSPWGKRKVCPFTPCHVLFQSRLLSLSELKNCSQESYWPGRGRGLACFSLSVRALIYWSKWWACIMPGRTSHQMSCAWSAKDWRGGGGGITPTSGPLHHYCPNARADSYSQACLSTSKTPL